MTLAVAGQESITRMNMIFIRLAPSMDAKTINNGIPGNMRITSVTLIRASSTLPPIYPDTSPTRVPMKTVPSEASRPTIRDILVP